MKITVDLPERYYDVFEDEICGSGVTLQEYLEKVLVQHAKGLILNQAFQQAEKTGDAEKLFDGSCLP